MSVKVSRPTFGLAFITWWAYFWRTTIFAVTIVVALGVLGAAFGIEKDSNIGVREFFGSLAAILTSTYVIYRMLTKGFGRYRLALVEK